MKRGLLLIAPASLALLCLFVIPLGILMQQSLSVPAPVGIASYTRFFGDSYYLMVLGRTLLVGTGVTLTCMLLATPVSLWLARIESRWVPLLLVVATFPLWISGVVRSFAWMVLFFRNGLLSVAMQQTGLVSPSFQFMGTLAGVIIALSYVLLPLAIVTLYPVMRSIDPDLENAALNLGAKPLTTLFTVTLPLARAGMAASGLLVFSLAVGAFSTPSLIGGIRAQLMAVAIQQQILDLLDWPFGSAMAAILLVVAVTAPWLSTRFTARTSA